MHGRAGRRKDGIGGVTINGIDSAISNGSDIGRGKTGRISSGSDIDFGRTGRISSGTDIDNGMYFRR